MGNKLLSGRKRDSVPVSSDAIDEEVEKEKILEQEEKQRKNKIVYGYCRAIIMHYNYIFPLDILNIIYEYVTFEIEKIKYKILFLGAGEVGKATIFKQIRHSYGRQFDESELIAAKPHLTQNIIEAMRTLAIYSDILGDKGKNTKVCQENEEIRKRVAMMSDKQKYTKQHYEDFKVLWEDPGIQKTAEYSNQFQLIDTFEFLFKNMNKYWKDTYIPTINDVMILRQRTTGCSKIKFVIYDDNDYYTEYLYSIFNTGGQKNERRKWMHFFPNTQIVIDVINLSGFHKLLWEDSRSNRLREDIGLFRGIINLDILKDCYWIVILNKFDLFCKDIERGILFREHFKDFNGNNTSNDIIDFIKSKLLDQIRENETKRRDIYFYVTNALNTECIKNMFHDIHQTFVKK